MTTQLIVKWKSNKEALCQSAFSKLTLILPSVSVGNVGQLAIDILLTTLHVEKAAIFHHPALLPIVGYDPYNRDSEEITTAADLHICLDKNVMILQIRSPPSRESINVFLSDLNDWFKECGFQKVVILGSCHAHLRHDSQLSGCQWRHITNEAAQEINEKLLSAGFIQLEERENEQGNKKRMVPGAGFLYRLLNSSELPMVGLLGFVDEGDNTKDAFDLVSYVNEWLQLQKNDDPWRSPFSWKNLFGPPLPQMLY